jgi:hypothetical protein
LLQFYDVHKGGGDEYRYIFEDIPLSTKTPVTATTLAEPAMKSHPVIGTKTCPRQCLAIAAAARLHIPRRPHANAICPMSGDSS